MSSAGLRLILCLFTVFAFSTRAVVPEDLSNFLNEFVCDTNVRLVRPQTHSDVEEAVRRHTHVMAVGVGHSSNLFFCAASPEEGEDGSSAIIIMTTVRPLVIEVNETEMSVWVSAGVSVWDLMDYLGNYVTPSAPRGYALGSTPQYVNQTIAGSIATGTHGSSLTYGSLSNQVIGFRVVLANGTTAEIYPDSHPLYFKAFQVNVGRLGVVTDVKMRIIKETLVERALFVGVPEKDIMQRIREAQEMYKSTGGLPEWMFFTAFSWNPVDYTFLVWEFRETDSPSGASSDGDFDDLVAESQEHLEYLLSDKINSPVNLSRTEGDLDVAEGVSWDEPTPVQRNPFFLDVNSTALITGEGINDAVITGGNDTLETHKAALKFPISVTETFGMTLVDEYEESVPMDRMADCLEGVIALLKSQAPDTGLRTLLGFRLAGKETGLLSVANDHPRLWFSAQDFVYSNREVPESNVPFKRFVAFLMSSPLCSPARLHWGKSGWPDPGCWNGAELYPDTWCDFGCAVRDLDPEGKFDDTSEVWNWEGANLEECCSPDGYNKSRFGCECAVVRRRHPDECPEAPFYSNR